MCDSIFSSLRDFNRPILQRMESEKNRRESDLAAPHAKNLLTSVAMR